MRSKLFASAAFILLIWSLAATSQGQKIAVKLSVSADSPLKGEIESYVRRELRALSDIDSYSSTPEFEIQLVAIEPGSAVAISIVVVKKYDFSATIDYDLRSTNLTVAKKDSLKKLLAKQESVVYHSIYSDSRSRLDDLCKRIVAQIDNNAFEDERKLNSLLSKYIRESQSEILPKTTSKPTTDGESPFTKEYVGSDYALINIVNQTDRRLTLIFGGVTYFVEPKQSREIKVDGGRYEFSASVPRARPTGGITDFAKGYRHSWRFYIVTRRA